MKKLKIQNNKWLAHAFKLYNYKNMTQICMKNNSHSKL